MIIAQFKQGNPIPIYPYPAFNAIRGRVIGRAGYDFRTRVYDLAGRVRTTPTTAVGITDPYDFEDFDKSSHDAVLGWGEGIFIYSIEVLDPATGDIEEQLALLVVISYDAAKMDVTDMPEKCEVLVVDKDQGLRCLYQVPATTARIAYGKFITTLYKFDPAKKQAFIRIYYGTPPEPTIVDLGWFTRAILTFDYRFDDNERLLSYLVNNAVRHTTIPDQIYDLLTRTDVPTTDKVDALLPYAQVGIQHDLQGRVIGLRRVGGSQPVLSVDVYYKAGWLNINWMKLIGFMTLGATAATVTAIVGAALLGVAPPIGAAILVGLMIGATTYFLTESPVSEPPTEAEKAAVEKKAEAGKKEVDVVTEQALGTVERLVAEGKVTPEAGEQIKADIERIRVTAKTVIDEVVDEAKRQIDVAYGRGLTTGGLIGGVAGTVVGGVIGYAVAR